MSWSLRKRAVLVPFDPFDDNRQALEVARSFVEQPGQVTVLYVLPTLPPLATLAEERNLDQATHRDEATKVVRDVLRQAGAEDFQVWVRQGQAADVIVDTAARELAELIVMPSHGRTGLQRWVLGSVTERVVRLAPCPVLVLRMAETNVAP